MLKAKSRVTLSLPTDLLPWELMQENENMTKSEVLNWKEMISRFLHCCLSLCDLKKVILIWGDQ